MEKTQDQETISIDIEKVFRDKNPAILKWIPRFVISYLKRVIHQDSLNEMLTTYPHSYNVDFGQICTRHFGVKSKSLGLENIPRDGRYLFVSNHPLGGLDGIIFMNEVSRIFDHIKFPVNDILLQIGRFNDIFVPINKHGGHSREAATLIEDAFASKGQVLFFPAGLVSRKQKGGIKDLEWKPNFVKKAIKHQRAIIPVHIEGRNSNFFYNLARLRKFLGIKANIEMLYLVDEMFKQKDKNITLRFGTPIPWSKLKNGESPKTWAEKIKETVYSLPKLI
ncbi:1-acyl-sn-glycerol-3-phosphate acyltransferase [Saccharicrinis fermentans]|uniref:2-acyl-glycerophospho-ethanolamine acyltransferase n=1 Tax=Saccharicrinis fermentans DSM 9555 = JCM 21142 TaxID=869213 RepID=W7YDU8_9BACT|nr:1-acyl-sn-glycerol-3-phosphate acyltransferase [Saccharicrinis fermentans]GAF02646.1 2-acyl-glycerophospho-ethanolamine acyltransferase [Saccharicrinis fermentans DSM 9555 = JCM 21142]